MNIKMQNGLAHRTLKAKRIFIASGSGYTEHKGLDVAIKPQQSATVILEPVNLLDTELGIIFGKKELHKNGILITGTDIVHPTFNGNLSITIFNFSAANYHISTDGNSPLSKLAEIIIFEDMNKFNYNRLPTLNEESYKSDILRNYKHIPDNFIATSEAKTAIIKNINDNLSKKTMIFMTSIAVILALSPVISFLTSKQHFSDLREYITQTVHIDKNEDDVKSLLLQNHEIIDANRKLMKNIEILKAQLQSITNQHIELQKQVKKE